MSRLYRIITAVAVVLCTALLGRIGLAAQPTATIATSEAWRLGITSEDGAADAALVGRPASIAAAFRSNRGVQDIFFAFPASGRTQTVQSAAYRLLQRSGTYTSTTSLTLEARDSSGTLLRTVSAAPVDLQTVATGAWAALPLDASSASLAIAPGEHLVAHFALAGAPAGTLDLRPVFEIIVTSDPGTAATSTPTATATATATPLTTPTTTQSTLYLPVVER
jgi:hypothetical protein